MSRITKRAFLAAGLTAAVFPTRGIGQIMGPGPDQILHDPDQPVLGNPNGDVTIVEYFDYQCPYCRRDHPALLKLVEADGGIRLLMKDWPVFGPPSQRATKMALGSVRLGTYPEAHEAMMALKGRRLSDRDFDAALGKAGIDPKDALASFEADADLWMGLLSRNDMQVGALGIRGTPAYIIGRDLFAGAFPLAELRLAVERTRVEAGNR
ncbi:DsbA family protein [Frigidibacter sp. MR17.14]|uniref:DsbA family protein n=1 Tax=Frigidibacter sp. MR17.14 TaxID=3126509 RepID=UPI0030129D36